MDTHNILLKHILNAANNHSKQAAHHKLLHRSLWAASSFISIAVAVCTAFNFEILGITSKSISTIFAILLPVVTSYIFLRSPEKLWIHEINIRNQLLDLHTEVLLLTNRNSPFEPSLYEQRFLTIMAAANKKWIEIKEG